MAGLHLCGTRPRAPLWGGAGEPAALDPLDGEPARAVAAEDAAPDTAAHARELGEVLQAAIGSLPAESREVIVLRDVEGLSAEEAAQVVGIEVGALKSRLHRARLELRRLLSDLLRRRGEAGRPRASLCRPSPATRCRLRMRAAVRRALSAV